MKARVHLSVGRILLSFFGFFIGVGLLAIGFFLFMGGFRARAFEERGVIVPGKVVETEKRVRTLRDTKRERRNRTRTEETLVVTYEFTTELGQLMRGTARLTYEEPPQYRTGDDIRVIYDSARVNVFAIYEDSHASAAQFWGSGVTLMALGLVFLLPIYFGFRKRHGSVSEQLFQEQIAFVETQLGHDDPRLVPTLQSYAKFLRGRKRDLEADALEARIRRLRGLEKKS